MEPGNIRFHKADSLKNSGKDAHAPEQIPCVSVGRRRYVHNQHSEK
ncbi:hypothetical protein [Endozoicomonas sp. ALD040]